MDVAVLILRNMKIFPNLPVCISTGSSPTPSYTDGHRTKEQKKVESRQVRVFC